MRAGKVKEMIEDGEDGEDEDEGDDARVCLQKTDVVAMSLLPFAAFPQKENPRYL